MLLIVEEDEIRSCIGLDRQALAAVSTAFAALSEGRARMPPILRIDLPEANGEMDVKTAVILGEDSFCLKISTGFFNNPALGLPSLGGLMAVFDTKTGQLRALLLDNGYLTNIRTALAGALAADALSVPKARVATVFGAGAQARLQAQALMLVRDIVEFRIHARDLTRATACAADIAQATGRPARAVRDVGSATAGAHIIVTTTPACEPILRLLHVDPGTHITAIGSDAPHKREIATDLIFAADAVVVDDRSQSERLGELHAVAEAGRLNDVTRITTLGDVTTSRTPGRRSTQDITICDLSGTGAQDTAIAAEALRRLIGAAL